MEDKKQVDDILRDIERQQTARDVQQNNLKQQASADDFSVSQIQKKREEQVKEFKLDLDLADVEIPERSTDSAESVETESDVEFIADNKTAKNDKTASKRKSKSDNGCLKRALYVLFIVVISVLIAFLVLLYGMDALGIGRSSQAIDVEIPEGAYTQQIADILEEKDLIEYPLFFRIYAKLTKADGLWQFGSFSLSADMGYSGMVEKLQTSTPRANVNVTIPEGFNVEDIAKLLEEKNVCSSEEFYRAIVHGTYDYDFVKTIPTAADGKEFAGRIYRLEGYLFPDTYNFYENSSGEAVVDKMLANFDQKLSAELRQQMSNKGWNIDQTIIFASIVQGEAAKTEDMYAVSKVLSNRLEPNSGFPKLQCDSTRDYVREILPSIPGVEVTTSPYDTYVREGLPVGAINNPGLTAIKAALNPSTDKTFANCYYFATDYDTGITYFSKTLAQHEAICRKYKIGMYG